LLNIQGHRKHFCIHLAWEVLYFSALEIRLAFNQVKLESLKTDFLIHISYVSYISTCIGDVDINCDCMYFRCIHCDVVSLGGYSYP